MHRNKSSFRRAATQALLLAVIVLSGIASVKTSDLQAQVTMTYKFTQGIPLSYKQSSGQTQYIDVMGQTMTTETSSSMDITLKPKGTKDGNHLLNVTIDNMSVSVQSPQGAVTPDLSGVIGKSFDLVLSPLGKEVDVSGASAFFMDMGESGRRDLSSNFQGLFPDLPDHPVKVGDKWPSEDNIIQKSDTSDIRIVYKNENTLDGFETIDGRECARIVTALKATISGALNQAGMSLSLDARLAGSETWFFAVKEGVFVKAESKGTMEGAITTEAMPTPIGFTGETRNTNALVKK